MTLDEIEAEIEIAEVEDLAEDMRLLIRAVRQLGINLKATKELNTAYRIGHHPTADKALTILEDNPIDPDVLALLENE